MNKKKYKIIDEKTTYIDQRAKIGDGVVIYPNNTITGDCVIGDNTVIEPNNIIENSKIGSDCKIIFSVLKGCVVESGSTIGPFAYIRQDSVIEDGCKIGSFVEIKASEIGTGSKVPHLSYVGDAQIGEKCNIGCGVVFANYDGKNKYKSKVGDNCFIGSNSNVIAPVDIGDNSYIAAATTVTENVADSSFVIGRVKQQLNDKLKYKYIPPRN